MLLLRNILYNPAVQEKKLRTTCLKTMIGTTKYFASRCIKIKKCNATKHKYHVISLSNITTVIFDIIQSIYIFHDSIFLWYIKFSTYLMLTTKSDLRK